MSSFCDEIQKLGKGIDNAARYRMLGALMKGPRSVRHLVRVARLSQPAVSQHLQTLSACNLVSRAKRGQEVYYSLNARYVLSTLSRFLANVKRCPQRNS